MTARAVGPVEQHLAGQRCAETLIELLTTIGCPRGDELFATAKAVQLTHGDEGLRAFMRRVQKHVEGAANEG